MLGKGADIAGHVALQFVEAAEATFSNITDSKAGHVRAFEKLRVTINCRRISLKLNRLSGRSPHKHRNYRLHPK